MDRRQLLIAGLASPLGVGAVRRAAADPIYIGDMHSHLFFFGPQSGVRPAAWPRHGGGNATLVSWSLVGDLPWLG